MTNGEKTIRQKLEKKLEKEKACLPAGREKGERDANSFALLCVLGAFAVNFSVNFLPLTTRTSAKERKDFVPY